MPSEEPWQTLTWRILVGLAVLLVALPGFGQAPGGIRWTGGDNHRPTRDEKLQEEIREMKRTRSWRHLSQLQ
jgi:hypothetical protein